MLRIPRVIRPSTCAPCTVSVIISDTPSTAWIRQRLDEMILSRKMKCSEITPACGESVAAFAEDGNEEVDVAKTHLLKHLRLLAELCAGVLVDRQLAPGQLLQLRGEQVAEDAVARGRGGS